MPYFAVSCQALTHDPLDHANHHFGTPPYSSILSIGCIRPSTFTKHVAAGRVRIWWRGYNAWLLQICVRGERIHANCAAGIRIQKGIIPEGMAIGITDSRFRAAIEITDSKIRAAIGSDQRNEDIDMERNPG